jgi:hypothetical protein
MRVCGVEIKSNEAVICLLSMKDEIFDIRDCRVRKVTVEKKANGESLSAFQSTFAKLMTDYKVDKVIIRERPTKGKFAGSAIGFKIEAAIQLIDNLEVELVTPVAIKEYLKKNPVSVAFADTGLKIFQEIAFTSAYGYLMNAHYSE